MGMYDSIKPVLLVGPLEGNFLASFPSRMDCHHWCRYRFLPSRHHPSSYDDDLVRPSSTSLPWMLVARLSPRRVSSLSSRVLVPTFSVVWPVPVSCPSTIKCRS